MLRRVALVTANVLKERISSIIRKDSAEKFSLQPSSIASYC
jgi:hypothetical protein